MLSVFAKNDPNLKLHRFAHFGEVSSCDDMRTSPEKPPLSAVGTVRAKFNLVSSVPVDSSGQPAKHGGARNRSDRTSDHLTIKQVENIIGAAGFANEIGLALNRMLTIHWQQAGLVVDDIVKATGRFCDLLAKALGRHRHETAIIWVQENGFRKCGGPKGGHIHLLAHIPAAMVKRIDRLKFGWLRSITGQSYTKGVILSRPVGGKLGIEITNELLHFENLSVAVGYLVKGASQMAAAQFGLSRLEAGGVCIGKRCSVSQNIGEAARVASKPTSPHIGEE